MTTDVNSSIYIARQPIVDRKLDLVGFELLFPTAAAAAASPNDGVCATSTVIAHAFADIGIEKVLGGVDGYLNVDEDLLSSHLIEALPAQRVVIELRESAFLDDHVLDRVAELRSRSFRVAIDDFVGNHHDLDALLPLVDVVKVDFEGIDALAIPVLVGLLAKHDVTMIAAKVETRAQFVQARELGIGAFQGFHFAEPEVIAARRPKPSHVALIRLMSLVTTDAENAVIEAELGRHPDVALSLLRLASSAAMGQRQAVTSLRHALMLIGRRQLSLWLQLLLYTADGKGPAFGNPLLQMAAARGRFMSLIAERIPGPKGATKDLAFMTGILSLMDAAMKAPLADILSELNVVEVVRAALIERSGEIGAMLDLAEALERGNVDRVLEAATELPNLEFSEVHPLQLEAFRWATEIVVAAK